jgi:hypothetical protein
LHIISTKTEKVRHFSNPEVLLCYCPVEKTKINKSNAVLLPSREFCVFKKEILQEKDAKRRRRQKTRFFVCFLDSKCIARVLNVVCSAFFAPEHSRSVINKTQNLPLDWPDLNIPLACEYFTTHSSLPRT